MTIDLEQLLLEIGALKQGHFLLSSGLHSDRYIEKFDLLRNPQATSEALKGVANHFRQAAIDVVVGPTTGGIILAFELARQLGVAAAFAERTDDGSIEREFRRGTKFSPGSRVLIVDDILTTGGSIRETLHALENHPVQVAGIAVLVDRTEGRTTFPQADVVAALRMRVDAWEFAECPLCASGIPLSRPGTTTSATAQTADTAAAELGAMTVDDQGHARR